MSRIFSSTLVGAVGHHLQLPAGERVDVGSGKHAHNPERRDRIPGPGDQYGARWASEQGSTRSILVIAMKRNGDG